MGVFTRAMGVHTRAMECLPVLWVCLPDLLECLQDSMQEFSMVLDRKCDENFDDREIHGQSNVWSAAERCEKSYKLYACVWFE